MSDESSGDYYTTSESSYDSSSSDDSLSDEILSDIEKPKYEELMLKRDPFSSQSLNESLQSLSGGDMSKRGSEERLSAFTEVSSSQKVSDIDEFDGTSLSSQVYSDDLEPVDLIESDVDEVMSDVVVSSDNEIEVTVHSSEGGSRAVSRVESDMLPKIKVKKEKFKDVGEMSMKEQPRRKKREKYLVKGKKRDWLQRYRFEKPKCALGWFYLACRFTKRLFFDVYKFLGFVTGILVFIIFQMFDIDGNPKISATAALGIVMAIWWVLEVVPLAVTALLPLFVLPLFGVVSGGTIATKYVNTTVFTFLGGFIVAKAMERWELHKRIALRICLVFGSWPKILILGMMGVTWFLSMWISNTAATLTMVTNAIAISDQVENAIGEKNNLFSRGLFLGIAYAASIGGTATIIGTAPNLALVEIMKILFPEAPEITFGQWFVWAFPVSFLFLIILWIAIVLVFARKRHKIDTDVFSDELEALGSISFEEVVILFAFLFLALMWIFRADLDLGFLLLPGWGRVISWYHGEGFDKFITDGVVAILVASVLFFIPASSTDEMIEKAGGDPDETRYRSGYPVKKVRGSWARTRNFIRRQYEKRWDTRILDGNCFKELPWQIVLLFGGGFALAFAFVESGLSEWVAEQLELVQELQRCLDKLNFPHFSLTLIVVMLANIMIKSFTEITSNTATAQVFLPILGSLAVALEIHPFLIMVPATLSCSYAFMLPVATPPNMVVFGSGRVSITTMAIFGSLINSIAIVLVFIVAFTIIPLVFQFNITEFPEWAIPT